MKLRIKGNSIRLRLGKSEVLRLALVGLVEECTLFGAGVNEQFEYSICACSDEAGMKADFDGRSLRVRVPWGMILQWTTTEQVSMAASQHIGGAAELEILIEKDFACIDASAGESQEDAFANPQLAAGCQPAGANRRSA